MNPYQPVNPLEFGNIPPTSGFPPGAGMIINNRGLLRDGYGWGGDHGAYDFETDEGRYILAAAAGRVKYADSRPACGEMQTEILIDHTVDGGSNSTLYDEIFVTGYAHMRDVLVAAGDWVSRGTRIGTVGDNGCSSAPHLHFGAGKLTNTSTSRYYDLWGKPYDQIPEALGEVVIDPYGWYSINGAADPWASKALAAGKGALSVNLWRDGDAPPRGDWD